MFFKSDESQVRVLAFDRAGNLIAGTDGSGLIYRITPQGEGFVLYSAPKKEITALAVDAEGNIYAAGAGDKRGAAPLPPPNPRLRGRPQPPTTIVIQQGAPQAAGGAPGVAAIPFPNVMNLGGSEVYRISPDGAPKTIWSSKDELVYALAFDQSGRLLAGTGNKGRIYAIRDGEYADLVQSQREPGNSVRGGTSRRQSSPRPATSGRCSRSEPSPIAEGTYESDVFDAKIFSKWGRAEVHGSGNFDLFARSGNVENPDRNWSPWKKVDLAKDSPVDAPPARFIQWKAVLHSGNPAADRSNASPSITCLAMSRLRSTT